MKEINIREKNFVILTEVAIESISIIFSIIGAIKLGEGMR